MGQGDMNAIIALLVMLSEPAETSMRGCTSTIMGKFPNLTATREEREKRVR